MCFLIIIFFVFLEKALSEAAIGTITGILALIVLILLPIDYVLSQRRQKTQKVWERRSTKRKRKERVAAFTFVTYRQGEHDSVHRPPIVLMHPASPDLQPVKRSEGEGQENGNPPVHDALSVRSDRRDQSSIGSLLSDTAEYDSSYSYDNSKSKKKKRKKKKKRLDQDDETMELQNHFQGENFKKA